MLKDKQTYWVTFDVSFTPRKPHSDVYKFNTMTAVLSHDDFEKVSSRKEFIINGVKQKLEDWHKEHKYKKEKSEEGELKFNDGKVSCRFSHFVVKRMDLDLL